MIRLDLMPETYHEFKEHMERLGPDAEREWGTLSVTDMLRHLRKSVDVSSGKEDQADRSIPVARVIIRIVFFDVITRWPRGVLKSAPEWITGSDSSFDEEMRLLLEALDRFVEAFRADPDRKTISPLLGPITLRYWGHVHRVHFNHHLRQFGVV